MDPDHVPTAEELAAEQADLNIPKEEDIRAKLIEDYGFDESVDAERLDKLTKKELEDRKRLSKTINQKIKFREAAKAKAGATPPADDKKGSQESDLSSRDVLVLSGAGVTHEEDIDEVVEYAKYKKISIADALKVPLIKNSLAEKAEVRKTAGAQNTGQGRRSQAKPTDDQIVEKAIAGEDVDAADFATARFNQRKEKASGNKR